MQLSRRVALDGVQLDSVDGRILIQSIETAAGREQISAVSLAGGAGSRVTGKHRDYVDIVVKFSINEKSYRPEARDEVLEKVNTWAAAGGWMTVNYKPDRKIRVIAEQLPGEGDIRNRGNSYAITFRAYGVPYWQEDTGTVVRIQNTQSVTRQVGLGGNQDAPAEFSFQNTSGSAVNTLSISCGGHSIAFSGLGLASGETLEIDHEDDGERCLQRIRIRSTGGTYRSAMDKRSGSDEIMMKPGVNNVSISAGGTGTIIIRCAGRFA